MRETKNSGFVTQVKSVIIKINGLQNFAKLFYRFAFPATFYLWYCSESQINKLIT